MAISRSHFLQIVAFSLIILLAGCSKPMKAPEVSARTFTVRGFNPLVNWKFDSTGKESRATEAKRAIFLDYTDAMKQGFVIPTIRQTPDGFFEFRFDIKNKESQPQKFAYKIYYQNESYKFPERDPQDSLKQNPYALENFYGSWEEVSKTFAETEAIPADNEYHQVTDKFRIVGNPRDEQRYYSDGVNDRWKRNPRVGEYSFMLVVTTPSNIEKNLIPEDVRNISKVVNNSFTDPWFYFLYGPGKKLENTIVSIYPYTLHVIAKPDLGAGIYINPLFAKSNSGKKAFNSNCGQDSAIYKRAQFDQFIHYIDYSAKFSNIPVIADVLNDNYSKMDYNWNSRFYAKDELISTTASTTLSPCETVISDPVSDKIIIKNPGAEYGNWRKENVGVITRNGFVYGKWTVKAKLTELLNRNNMWNGLTNAIWLITMSQSDWNMRRDCNNGGYMANYYGGQKDVRVKNVGYSEIDFEILKTVPYCPHYVLPPVYNHAVDNEYNISNWNVPFPEEITSNDGMIQVACTNWDMACWDPGNFAEGCSPIVYKDQVFWAHRWDKNYRAITTKVPEPDDELFGGPYYYFQIDWQPDQIIWRIGPSKDKLRVVGYVNSTVTSIPNNQMLLIITQEFHNTVWWVGSMYAQENIPFPKNDIIGEIYEVTIE